MMETRIARLFGIRYPIVQAGMVWTSGHALASAVSEAGALGLIGAGSMKPGLLREHIHAARAFTSNPIGVNVPLLRGDAADLINTSIEEGIRIIFTSAGHPAKYIDTLKQAGCTVVHVISNVRQARKAEESGCDAVVAEGFEAGGHNGMDEITTLCLVPQVVDAVSIPVIGAGGVADGRGIFAVLALGAEGVQIGTRFAATIESSVHDRYKSLVLESGDTGTVLALRSVAPVRLLKTPFAFEVLEAERAGRSREELLALLGTKREMRGMLEGNLEEGEFEAGQSAGLVRDLPSAGELVARLVREYDAVHARMTLPPDARAT